MFMDVAKHAFYNLYPKKTLPELSIKFSGHFKDFNANVSIKKQGRAILGLEFGLSKNFSEVENEIQMGIIQHLLNKVYKTKVSTLEQDLYHSFIKNLTRYAKQKESDPFLVELYEELNLEYFNSLLEQPNIVFGSASSTTLGHYTYATDTVVISTVLKADRELLKYVLYHELLHKKHSFKVSKSGRNNYHTPAFKRDEAIFHDKNIEKKLTIFLTKKKLKKYLFW